MCAALQAYEAIMAQSKVLVKTAYSIASWFRSWVTTCRSGVVQTPTMLGPVIYETLSRNETPMESYFPVRSKRVHQLSRRPGDIRTGLAERKLAIWTAVAVCLNTDELCGSIQMLGKVALWLLKYTAGLSLQVNLYDCHNGTNNGE